MFPLPVLKGLGLWIVIHHLNPNKRHDILGGFPRKRLRRMNLDKKVCFEKTGFTSIQLYMFWGSFFCTTSNINPFWGFVTPWAVPSTRPMAPMEKRDWKSNFQDFDRISVIGQHLSWGANGGYSETLSMVILVSNVTLCSKRALSVQVCFFKFQVNLFWNRVAGSNAQNGQSLKKQTWGVLWQLFGKLVR